jgi:hypothetical protein
MLMALFVFSWLPWDSILVGFVGGDGIYLRRDWLLGILLLMPFSLFLGSAIVGILKVLKKYLFEPR